MICKVIITRVSLGNYSLTIVKEDSIIDFVNHKERLKKRYTILGLEKDSYERRFLLTLTS